MATATVNPAPTIGPAGYGERKRFRRDEVDRMLELGLLTGQRLELIDGELINKMGQGPRHSAAIQFLLEALLGHFAARRIRIQLPIEAGTPDQMWSQPEPDVAVLNEWKDDFLARQPKGAELAFLIEVADSSVREDLNRKREIYAAAGVPDYRVLDVDQRRMVIFRDLRDGDYRSVVTLTDLDIVPNLDVTVASLLGPA